jgi:hypothetical protein
MDAREGLLLVNPDDVGGDEGIDDVDTGVGVVADVVSGGSP